MLDVGGPRKSIGSITEVNRDRSTVQRVSGFIFETRGCVIVNFHSPRKSAFKFEKPVVVVSL